MGEVEDVEIVEAGKHLPLDLAQLVPRQPVMVVHHNHTTVKTALPIYFLRSIQFKSPEPVEFGQSREVGAVHL